jgi:hypothetical protein
MLIKTSTYPFGPANKLPDDTIVQRVQFNGRFIDAYKGELIEGNRQWRKSAIDSKGSSMCPSLRG